MSELELRNILKLLKIISKKQPDLLKKQCFYIYGHPKIFSPPFFPVSSSPSFHFNSFSNINPKYFTLNFSHILKSKIYCALICDHLIITI